VHCILFYEYVEGILEKRQPHREAHLALARSWVAEGRLLLGGAFTEPADGAALVFQVESPAEVEAFVAADPYVAAGLVTSWRVRPWAAVVGSLL
jgi:uncharacterized protein YciI